MASIDSSSPKIRDARPEERPALEELQRRASEHDSPYRDRLRAEPDLMQIPPEHMKHVRVAEDDGTVVGFSVLLPADYGACELDGLFVEPDRWRNGTGRALVEDAAATARARGATRIEVTANPQALAFYEALGFHTGEQTMTRLGPAPRMTLGLPPELADDTIALVALTQDDVDDLLELSRVEDVAAYTLVRSDPDRDYVSNWIAGYERGWHDGSRAGFSIRDARDRAFLGFAAVVDLRHREREGELGYMLVPSARGRGAAGRAVELLTRWCFDVLGLERLELRIDTGNEASARLAERAGYRLEGVLRNTYFKEGRRADVGLWARLRRDDDPG